MKMIDCRKCENCIGHTCDVFFMDIEKALYECFKTQFENYKEKKTTGYTGISFKRFSS